jgi:glycosyltransferase involved in cell wall biosynthesis
MSSPRFSIVITCYNQHDFIRAAVDSALAQCHPSKEIIVVDDGSSDGSPQILEQYGEMIKLVRFPTNRGALKARNHGAGCATGEYLVFLDGDDLFMPWALEVYEGIVAQRNPAIIFGQLFSFRGEVPEARADDAPQKTELVLYDSLLAKDRPLTTSASNLVVRRNAFLEVGGWSPGIFHMDVMDIGLKLGQSGPAALVCSPATALYRIHEGNSIHSVPPFLQMAARLIAKEQAGEYPGGTEHRVERFAWLGGMSFFWTKRALRASLYKDAFRLAITGRLMILRAIVCRSVAWLKGRRPVEVLQLPYAGARVGNEGRLGMPQRPQNIHT